MEQIGASWATLLRTRKRDGSWVGTPVNLAPADGRAYFGTPADSDKVKRLRNFATVEVAPCTLRGKPTGPALAGRARRLHAGEAERAEAVLRERHRLMRRLVPLELALKRTSENFYAVEGLRPLGATEPEPLDRAPALSAARATSATSAGRAAASGPR